MKLRHCASLALTTAILIATALAVPTAVAQDADTAEDVIYMNDGRVLHGRILEETANEIVFELVNRKFNLKTKLTISLDDITHVERGAEFETGAENQAEAPMTRARPTSRPKPATSEETEVDESLPAFYIVPIKGQVGTDVHLSVYEKVAEDIRRVRPDLVIFEVDCKDHLTLMVTDVDEQERSMMFLDRYRRMIDLFRDDLRDIPQVVLIKDSVGISSLLALSWDEIYMTPTARLVGLSRVMELSGAEKWTDEDVRDKMIAAWTGIAKGFVENGGHSAAIAQAMMLPEYYLSASFKGREVIWQNDQNGQMRIDDDDEAVSGFDSELAEDLGISRGTVDEGDERFDDLAFLRGIREYRMLESDGQAIVDKYIEDWRKLFDNSRTWWEEYQLDLSWANGDDTLKYLGRAKGELNKIINAMTRYEAVERRWKADFGVSKMQLQVLEEQLSERIRALKRNRTRGGGGRTGPAGPGGVGG